MVQGPIKGSHENYRPVDDNHFHTYKKLLSLFNLLWSAEYTNRRDIDNKLAQLATDLRPSNILCGPRYPFRGSYENRWPS